MKKAEEISVDIRPTSSMSHIRLMKPIGCNNTLCQIERNLRSLGQLKLRSELLEPRQPYGQLPCHL